ncbi:MAG TPA: thiamine pyrophosphate-binding protein [Solirubrobacteraceae bacterium]|nr:thiamine pyrophosphate-binding protein [Solirubrobacteraceae bacterium]
MNAAEAVGRTLAALGVRDAFGVIGSGNFVATQALHAAGASFHHARHEGGAISMADAYARVSGRVGVCSVHQGPGFTNMLTGLTEAAKSRTPLLILAGEAPRAAVRSNFAVDQPGLAATLGAVPERIHSGASAAADTARALRRARVERRPVVLNLPLDVQSEPAPGGAAPGVLRPPERPAPAPEVVAQVAEAISSADRPVIVAGRGAVLAVAREPLERLGDAIGAVLATSAMGHGLFEGSPWAVGISGGFASPIAARLMTEADLVLAFGAGLTRWTTRDGALITRGAKVVQVDLDEESLGAHRPVDVAVVGDAAATAEALLAAGVSNPGFRAAPGLEQEIAAGSWRDAPFDDAGDATHLDPRTLSIALDRLLPAERTVAVDSGHFMGFPPMYIRVPDPQGFVFTQAFQSIGLGLASAIGAAVARPDRLTLACLGDGGALMALPELETLARLRLPLLVVVYNDAAYGAEVHHFGPQGIPLELVRFPDTDFAALARAAGAEGITARSVADLDPVAGWLERRDGPLVVDAKITPDFCAEWLEEAFK